MCNIDEIFIDNLYNDLCYLDVIPLKITVIIDIYCLNELLDSLGIHVPKLYSIYNDLPTLLKRRIQLTKLVEDIDNAEKLRIETTYNITFEEAIQIYYKKKLKYATSLKYRLISIKYDITSPIPSTL